MNTTKENLLTRERYIPCRGDDVAKLSGYKNINHTCPEIEEESLACDEQKDKIPTLIDGDNIQAEALDLLRKTFPLAEVIHENPHAGQYSVSNIDGKYGFCGFANGDLECDLYETEEDMAESDPLDNRVIAYVRGQR